MMVTVTTTFQSEIYKNCSFFKYQFFSYSLVFGQENVFLLPEAFCGLKHAENAIAAGPRWGSSRRSPDRVVGWGGDTSPHTRPHSAPLARRCSRLRRLDRRAPFDTKSWRRHWSPPLFKVKLRLCVIGC